MGGNTFDSVSGSLSIFPSDTFWRAMKNGFLNDLVSGRLGRDVEPSRIGTPLLMSVPSVRVNLATAVLAEEDPENGHLEDCGVKELLSPGRFVPKTNPHDRRDDGAQDDPAPVQLDMKRLMRRIVSVREGASHRTRRTSARRRG